MMLRTAFSALLIFFFCATALSQVQNATWHFSNGIGLKFGTETPEFVDSSIDSGLDRTPSSISDSGGNSLFYADESTIYAADGSILPDGTFNTFCRESIFCPVPGDANKYYFVRSNGTSGLDYSVIDLTLNDGLGDIIPDQKEIELLSIGGELNVVPKADGTGFWLISADNNNSSNECFIRTFDVNGEGISFHDEYTTTWIWIGWYPELDDAVISPDCSKLAVSFKGHYVGFMEYDSENGNAFNALNQSVNNFGSFVNITELEFGPESRYLYSLSDFNTVSQFDTEVFDQSSIQLSLTTVVEDPQSNWTDLKLAIDGKIYLLDNVNDGLDRLENPEMPAAEIEYTDDVILFDGEVSTYLPNTPNLICGSVIINFVPTTIDVCLGETTLFDITYNNAPDSVFWDFGDPESGDLNFSEELAPEHTYTAPGSYDVTVDIWYLGNLLPFELVANVYTYPDLEIGDDQVICEGEVVTLTAGEALDYLWNTGEETQSIEVAETGTYNVIASNGPCASEDEVFVEVIPLPVVDLGEDQIICDGLPIAIEANVDVTWNDGSVSDTFLTDTTGTYFGTVSNACFTVTDSVDITFVYVPANILPDSLIGCLGDTVYLFTGVVPAEVEWSWDGEVYEGDSLLVPGTNTYYVEYDYEGCLNSDEVYVQFEPYIDPGLVDMPNVFTPNSDDRNNNYYPIFMGNDELRVCSFSDILDVDMRIYNRWGNLIFEDGCSWDGRSESGEPMSEGVYYYIVEVSATCLNETELREISGSLTLKR